MEEFPFDGLGDFGWRSSHDVVGIIYPESHSSSSREGRREHRKRTEEFWVLSWLLVLPEAAKEKLKVKSAKLKVVELLRRDFISNWEQERFHQVVISHST